MKDAVFVARIIFSSGIEDGRVHYAGKFIGEEASLPCEVDYDRCGHIYFLTWSKNVSNEWQRVYLYSETYQTALGDFAFGGGNRVFLDATNMTSTGVAHLKIKSVSLEDEGTFKCDVTYVLGSCPSLTYTQLYILGKSGQRSIRSEHEHVSVLNPLPPPWSPSSRSCHLPFPAYSLCSSVSPTPLLASGPHFANVLSLDILRWYIALFRFRENKNDVLKYVCTLCAVQLSSVRFEILRQLFFHSFEEENLVKLGSRYELAWSPLILTRKEYNHSSLLDAPDTPIRLLEPFFEPSSLRDSILMHP